MIIDWKKDGKRFLIVVFAAILFALNIKIFVRAGDLFPGGVTGLTVLFQRLSEKYLGIELPYSPINLLLNAFPVYIGFRYIGKKFTLLSLLMIFLSGMVTDLLPAYLITDDPLLISVFGGILGGTAISLCLLADATSGGTDFIAIYLAQKHGMETWNLILAFNAVILSIAGFFFGWEEALYSIIYQFVSTQTLHTLYRNYQQQTLLVVTMNAQEVCDAIAKATHHGATILMLRAHTIINTGSWSIPWSPVPMQELRSTRRAALTQKHLSTPCAPLNCAGTSISGRKTDFLYK